MLTCCHVKPYQATLTSVCGLPGSQSQKCFLEQSHVMARDRFQILISLFAETVLGMRHVDDCEWVARYDRKSPDEPSQFVVLWKNR